MRKKQQNQDVKRMQAASLTKMIAMVGFVVAVIAFGSIAWFTMSREVEGSGVQMTSSDLPFEIATKGKNIRNDTDLAAANTPFGLGDEVTIDAVKYHQTTGDMDSIALMFDLVEDDPETADVNESNNKGIGPGDGGMLDLYIIPKETGMLNAYITMRVVGYVKANAYVQDMDEDGKPRIDEDGNPIYQTHSVQKTDPDTNEVYYVEENVTESRLTAIDDLSENRFKITSERISELREAQTYMQGHIMFFKEESGDAAYGYSEPLTDRMYHFDNNNSTVTKNKAYPVSIYWAWPNTFGQIALKSENALRNGKPIVQDVTDANFSGSDKEKVIQYLKIHQHEIFDGVVVPTDLTGMGLTSVDIAGKTGDQIVEMQMNQMIENADNAAYFKLLSTGYNRADFTIGSNVQYFLVELTVSSEKP